MYKSIVKLQRSRDDYFDENQLYYQWLHTRSALPLKMTRYVSKFLWAVAFVFIIFVNNGSYMSSYTLGITLTLTLVVLPLLLTFLYFLYFLPRVVSDDAATGFMGFVFASPISTRDIVSGIRKYFILLNLQIVLPALAAFGLGFLASDAPSFRQGDDWLMLGMVILCGICLWWFIMESGIMASTLPWRATISGGVFLLWILPVLALVGWGGYRIATAGWNYFLGDYDAYMYSRNSTFSYSTYTLINQMWFMLHYIVLMLIFTLYLFFNSNRFMEFRRRGKWG